MQAEKMSSQEQTKLTLEQKAKVKLVNLVKAIEPVVQTHLSELESDELNYILENFSSFLTYDLKRDFEEQRTKNLKQSPFDDLLDN